MDLEMFASLTTSDLFLYFLGGTTLIFTPAMIGVVTIWILFQRPTREPSVIIRRVGTAVLLSLGVAFGLGALGLTLLENAQLEVALFLLVLSLVAGMLGSGNLKW